jgi:hypothetical protein
MKVDVVYGWALNHLHGQYKLKFMHEKSQYKNAKSNRANINTAVITCPSYLNNV